MCTSFKNNNNPKKNLHSASSFPSVLQRCMHMFNYSHQKNFCNVNDTIHGTGLKGKYVRVATSDQIKSQLNNFSRYSRSKPQSDESKSRICIQEELPFCSVGAAETMGALPGLMQKWTGWLRVPEQLI